MIDKKEKKKALLKKNRRLYEIFNVMRLQRDEAERVHEMDEARPAPKKTDTRSDKDELGDKVASIRNRLTNQRRVSRERWNRFAATGDSGGRGL